MKEPNQEGPLYEKFTLEGFSAVSLLSFMLSFQLVLLIYAGQDLGFYQVESFINICLKTYSAIWFFVFLTECLIPKLCSRK